MRTSPVVGWPPTAGGEAQTWPRVRQARHNQARLGPTEPCTECSRILLSFGCEWGEYYWVVPFTGLIPNGTRDFRRALVTCLAQHGPPSVECSAVDCMGWGQSAGRRGDQGWGDVRRRVPNHEIPTGALTEKRAVRGRVMAHNPGCNRRDLVLTMFCLVTHPSKTMARRGGSTLHSCVGVRGSDRGHDRYANTHLRRTWLPPAFISRLVVVPHFSLSASCFLLHASCCWRSCIFSMR